MGLLAYVVERPLVERIDGNVHPFREVFGNYFAKEGSYGDVSGRDALVEVSTEEKEDYYDADGD